MDKIDRLGVCGVLLINGAPLMAWGDAMSKRCIVTAVGPVFYAVGFFLIVAGMVGLVHTLFYYNEEEG